jgi:poly(A) polymerase
MTTRTIDPPWRQLPDMLRVTEILQSAGLPYAFYGGAVRDALLGTSPVDIDMMVLAPQPVLLAVLMPTFAGVVLDHATIRINLGTLQIDLASVAYADYPGADSFEALVRAKAGTGDFTFNAFYLFPPDRFHDDYEGAHDLTEGRVRFIRNPYTQTRENPKYILRYFRFWVRFGKEAPDATILAACAANARLLPEIERARVYTEMRKLLSLPRPAGVLELMHRQQVLPYALGFPVNDFSPLLALELIEAQAGEQSPWYVRLFLLLMAAPLPPEKALEHLRMFWGFKPEQMKYLELILDYFPAADPAMPVDKKQALVKEFGVNFVKSLFFLRWTLEDDIAAQKDAYLAALKGIAIE